MIPADSDVIRKIINTFSAVHTEEVKIIKNKMLVKASAEFSFLYTTDTENEVTSIVNIDSSLIYNSEIAVSVHNRNISCYIIIIP